MPPIAIGVRMKKRHTDTRFALYVKDQVQTAIEFSIPLLTLEKRPKMSDQEYEMLIAENQRRYCAPVAKDPVSRAPQPERAGTSFDLEEPPTI